MRKLLSILLLLGGCSVKPVERLIYVNTPLPLPTRPSLPTWSGQDMSCLSDEMRQKVRDRDRLRKEYAEQLEAIINSTH